MFNTNQPFLTEIEIALTDEQFIADLKGFFTSGWGILKVLAHVFYLVCGQLYVAAGSIRRFTDAKLTPVNLKLYQICSKTNHPVPQFIAGLLKTELMQTLEVKLNGNKLKLDKLSMEP